MAKSNSLEGQGSLSPNVQDITLLLGIILPVTFLPTLFLYMASVKLASFNKCNYNKQSVPLNGLCVS